ncbi:ribonuclease HI family protein [Candidatus Roizmanbacteria bacterium]|nr:MAG: ribonuclease HI family protein [Candidatus Roizmanbacteria bacterium]
MNITVHTDGGSLNNPGQAAIGFHIDEGSRRIHDHSEAIGIASNNVAEYTALIRALTYLRDKIAVKELNVERILVIADSELMIKQVTGLYKVKNPDIRTLFNQVKVLEMELGVPISYKHVLRAENSEADALVKKALGR